MKLRLLISKPRDEGSSLDYWGGPNVIVRALICGGRKQKIENWRKCEKDLAGFKVGGKGH